MTDIKTRFSAVQRLLHWLMAIGILAMLFIGVGMVSTIGRQYVPLLIAHKTLGIAILVLALVRLLVRSVSGAPALPADLPEPMRLAAHLSHVALYALMIGMPLIGWAMMSAAFIFTDAAGTKNAVRWSLRPETQAVPISGADFAKLGPNHLEEDITERVANSPQRWTLVLTVAAPSDPTSDPTRAWPPERRTVEAGTLVVQKIEPEVDGPCRDINFDPTILPDGIKVGDDPFPAARSAAYARSYDLRTSEANQYPRTAASAKP